MPYATLQRVIDEDTKKVTGYKLVCEHGHETRLVRKAPSPTARPA